MVWLKLTNRSGKPLYVNMSNIIAMTSNTYMEMTYTRLLTVAQASKGTEYIDVKETPEEIAAMLATVGTVGLS